MFEIIGLLVLVVVNGLFSMGEIALVSSRKTRLEEKSKRGQRGATMALALLHHPDRLLSTVQIAITLISIVSGAFAGVTLGEALAGILRTWSWLAPVADQLAFGIVILLTTFLSLVVGELVPKSIALQNPESVAVVMAPVIHAVSQVTLPLVHLLSVITQTVLRMMGVQNKPPTPVSQEEFKLLIEEGVQHGVIEEEESALLKGIFRFDDRKAISIMTRRAHIQWINIKTPADTLRIQIASATVSKLVVCDGTLDRVLGFLSLKDCLSAILNGEGIDLAGFLTPPLYIPENMTGIRILEKFRQEKRYAGIVINEHGSVEGVITLHDLIESIVGTLPELDDDTHEVVTRQDGTLLVDGAMLLDELRDRFGLDIPLEPECSYATLGGLMMDHLKKVPVEGDWFEAWGHRFEVMDMDGKRVDKVLISHQEGVQT
ncbi:HlyC/CorC family transporter [bacterium]|nr:HlyC/CorC family transporter [bacterium]